MIRCEVIFIGHYEEGMKKVVAEIENLLNNSIIGTVSDKALLLDITKYLFLQVTKHGMAVRDRRLCIRYGNLL